MKRRHYLIHIIFLSLFSFTLLALGSPITMLENVSGQIIGELNTNKATLKSNPSKVFEIVNRLLLPHADMVNMARNVVGRDAWFSANTSQQQIFIQQFTDLLIHTYASALASYSNQTIKFYPIRGGWQGQSQVEVQSDILQPQGPPIPVSYRLIIENGQWKVVDMSVDNVSIVENYRAQFANDLSQGGLAYLNVKLTQHNAKLATRG